jgi:hypothetical protein
MRYVCRYVITFECDVRWILKWEELDRKCFSVLGLGGLRARGDRIFFRRLASGSRHLKSKAS